MILIANNFVNNVCQFGMKYDGGGVGLLYCFVWFFCLLNTLLFGTTFNIVMNI